MSSSEMTHICLIQLRRRERETRKREEGEKLIGINCTIVLVCVSKDPPETCAHFLTFHKVGVKYKYLYKVTFFLPSWKSWPIY